jgi:uncharacterized protein (TIGR00269 family)
MKCRCNKKAIIENPKLCKAHFQSWLEARVKSNVKRHKLFKKSDKLVCAVSGGKDSLTMLYLMKSLFSNQVLCLAVDEGISGYRDTTIPFIKRYCKEWDVPLHIFSFRDEFGKRLDSVKHPNCSICGVLRRNIMNRRSRDLGDILVTGHNMDDEVQTIMMNLIQNDYNRLARLGFIAGIQRHPSFIRRIKPLRNLSERQTATYFFSKGFDTSAVECPYRHTALRQVVRNSLNDLEVSCPGSKAAILNWFDKLKPKLKTEPTRILLCRQCNEPTSKPLCEACSLRAIL